MKHPVSTTMILLIFFLATQFLGLMLVAKAIPVSISETGEVTVETPDTALGPPPETDPSGALLMLIIGITLGTLLILLIIRFKQYNLWKFWFLLAAGLTMTVSFGVIFGEANYSYAALLGFVLAAWKIFRPNVYVHNFTELFIYPGIAVLFYHILSVPVMLLLLAIISIYDVIAVFKSKHMVSMANFQTDSRVFAGLAIPRSTTPVKKTMIENGSEKKTPDKKRSSTKKSGTAILGGGDVAFPLLFAAVVLKEFVASGMAKQTALAITSIIPVFAMIGLAALFFLARQGKFYPAMPAVSLGVIVGWGVTLLF